ncbi:MAG: hypothetical protein A3D67_00345 [Candidatus Lloydbacteria bacterium RIFCSPHIGHO2_02_FULL_51_22]|uniref:phosphomannomutase n=1 Tax=Candidatus Lloydbacteria bacterium RIFCSPHIGHO2_02_FULL_51_22 TaxID=1798663 RepID=A0A1G2DE64_9BACT|nr:MAG: hypothetical protein A3D67_00345 [Candidatus Lloydbacteria bacterium RIFCSPHIGHO2_02_FULL_51_22]
MENAKIVAFDLDQTLAESKMPLDTEMSGLLCALLAVKKVAVISGASFAQFQKQFLENLSCSAGALENLYLLPTNGASLYKYTGGWVCVYEHNLTTEEKQKIFDAFEKVFAQTGFIKPEKIYGTLVEDRETQLTFSGLGSDAPLALKEGWDPRHEKRDVLAAALRKELPGFTVSIGGATSIDVTREGIDKAFGLTELLRTLGYMPKEAFYVGDALFPGGNDASVIPLGIPYKYVEGGVKDTKAFLRAFLFTK